MEGGKEGRRNRGRQKETTCQNRFLLGSGGRRRQSQRKTEKLYWMIWGRERERARGVCGADGDTSQLGAQSVWSSVELSRTCRNITIQTRSQTPGVCTICTLTFGLACWLVHELGQIRGWVERRAGRGARREIEPGMRNHTPDVYTVCALTSTHTHCFSTVGTSTGGG